MAATLPAIIDLVCCAVLHGARSYAAIAPRAHVQEIDLMHRLGEDASRIRKGSRPRVMAALRNLTVGFLRTTGATNMTEQLRYDASRICDLFAQLGIMKQ